MGLFKKFFSIFKRKRTLELHQNVELKEPDEVPDEVKESYQSDAIIEMIEKVKNALKQIEFIDSEQFEEFDKRIKEIEKTLIRI